MSTADIAAALQSVGGALSASLDSDRLLVAGNGLATGLPRILGILAEVLTAATYPEGEVTTERARLIDRIQVAAQPPSHLARVALLRRMYGAHPYAVQTPEIAGLSELTARNSRRCTRRGCIRPARRSSSWATSTGRRRWTSPRRRWAAGAGPGPARRFRPMPPLQAGPGRAGRSPGFGAVVGTAGAARGARTHPDHAALQLANLVFGGYFSSRWVENIREDKGYTYSPHSVVEHSVAGSSLILSTEVATEVTAPALLETWYESGRLATCTAGEEELEQARQYALGSLLLGMSTQAGLAGLAITYAGYGLRLDFLAQHTARLAATRDEVAAAGATYLAPAQAATVVLGDAASSAS